MNTLDTIVEGGDVENQEIPSGEKFVFRQTNVFWDVQQITIIYFPKLKS